MLRRIKDRRKPKYNCAIAEVGDPDSAIGALGFAVVSNERGFTQSMVQKILQFIDDPALAKVIDDEQDFIDYGDGALEGSSRGDYPHWEPDEPSPPLGRTALPKPQKLAAVDYPGTALNQRLFRWSPAAASAKFPRPSRRQGTLRSGSAWTTDDRAKEIWP